MRPIYVKKGLFILTILLFASVSFAAFGAFESGPWKVSKGNANVLIFEPENIPVAFYYYALAVPNRPDDIFVTVSNPEKEFGNNGWRPKGLPIGFYVYVLNLKSETVSLMAWEDFKQLEINTDFSSRKWLLPIRTLTIRVN
jgi:hypothetical protein